MITYQNGKRNYNFSIDVKKHKCYRYKSPNFFKYKQILKKVLVSDKISYGEKNYKYLIGYLYND